MNETVTYIAPIKLATGVTEAQLLEESARFQAEFASKEPGILRRELIRKAEGQYMDIVLFRSEKDALEVIEKEQSSTVCQAFFALMDVSADPDMADMGPFPSLAVYE